MIFFTVVEEHFEIWWPECLQNTLISYYLNDLFHHDWRKFWNLMTWMPPKHFNFTLIWMIFFTMVEENFEIWCPECLQKTLISHYLNDLLLDGWRKFWNLMTWMPQKNFNFTLLESSSSPWLKNILKFDDLNTSKTL